MKTKLDSIEEKIAAAIQKMNDREEYFWHKFTYMEQVIQRLNSQSESLFGMLGN